VFCPWRDIVVDDDLLPVVVVKGIDGTGNAVIAELEYVRLKPEGFTGIRRSIDPQVPSLIVWIRDWDLVALGQWDWVDRILHSSDCKVVKPLSAISVLLSKIARGRVDCGAPNDVHRNNSIILAKVVISSNCIMYSGFSARLPTDVTMKFEGLISFRIRHNEVEESWINRVNLLEEGDPDMEVLRSITMAFLLSESNLDPLHWYCRVLEVISRQNWTARVSEEGASGAESELSFNFFSSIRIFFLTIVSSGIMDIALSRRH